MNTPTKFELLINAILDAPLIVKLRKITNRVASFLYDFIIC